MTGHLYCRFCESPAPRGDARFVLHGTAALYPPDRPLKATHLDLDLEVDLKAKTLLGRVETRMTVLASGVTEIHFDAVHFQIKKVSLNGSKAAFSYDKKRLTIPLKKSPRVGAAMTIGVDYSVTNPPLGLYFIQPDKVHPEKPWQVWTQGEDEYARYWFPCLDHPQERVTSSMRVTVPAGFVAVSNGTRLSVVHNKKNRRTTFAYAQKIPHASYLVTLTVGRFSEVKDRWKKVPVLYYCEHGREEDAKRAFGKTPAMLEHFSNIIGVPYPFTKYAQIAAHDFIYGGMENTSATTQTEYALLDERATLDYSSDELVAHELAHQWFGDYLTCKDWSHAWLNESFATYFDALFKRHDKGEAEFSYQMWLNANEYFAEDKDRYRRPIVTSVYRRPSDLFDRHLYEKGSVVLRMLHAALGDDAFFRGIKTYVQKNAGRTVETNDLIQALEEASGRNVRRFFDQWVFGPGHPEYKVRSFFNPKKKKMFVRVVQTNAKNGGPVFHANTDILFLTAKGEIRKTIALSKKSHLFEWDFREKPALVLFDPDHLLLKKAVHPKTEAEILLQLTKAPNPVSRIEAANEIGKMASSAGIAALKEVLFSNDFWGVRAAAARALGQIQTDASTALLVTALDDVTHPKVRRALYAALRRNPLPSVRGAILNHYKSEASYFAFGEALVTLASFGDSGAGALLDEAFKLSSWNDVIRVFATEAYGLLRSPAGVPKLVGLTDKKWHPRVRMAAIRGLMAVGSKDERVQPALERLVSDPFVLVRNAALRALAVVADERALPTLKKYTTGDYDGRTLRLAEEAVEAVAQGFETAERGA